MAEPPFDPRATWNLRVAAERIRDAIEAWSVGWREGQTIIHPGRVTGRYLESQGGKAPRSIVAVQRGETSPLSAGKNVNVDVVFLWYLIVPGTISDRAISALDWVAAATNFVHANPWVTPGDPACPFANKVALGSVSFQTLYGDSDEARGSSIWLVSWVQAIDGGPAAQTAEPLPEPLGMITIDNRTEPLPDGETLVETEVD